MPDIDELEQVVSRAEAVSKAFKMSEVADQPSLCASLSRTLHISIDLDRDAKVVRHLDDFAKSPSSNCLVQEGRCSLAAILALGKEVCVEEDRIAIN